MFLAPMVDDELREGLVEKTSVAKGLEPTLQVAAFDEPTQRFNVTVPLKHRASVASCPRDEAFINQQGPFHVRRRSSSTTTTSVVAYKDGHAAMYLRTKSSNVAFNGHLPEGYASAQP